MTQSDEIPVDEEEVINELRARMKNELPTKIYDDAFTLRNFLKARNFHLDHTEAMLRKHLEFRKQLQVDYIVQDFKPPEVLQTYMPQILIGYDKEGDLIRYSPLGNLDGKGIFKCANATTVLKTVVQVMQADVEHLKLKSKKTGKHYSKCIYIYNMEHMSLAKATHKKSIEYYLHGVSVFQDNYPEILKSVYIINASVYFTMVFALVQRMLAGSILSKIHVYGQDDYREALLKVIDADVLPAFLGGTRTDPDGNPLCHSFMTHGGMIPEKFHLKKNPQNLLKKPCAKVVTVAAQSDAQIPIYVENPNSILEWEYESSKNDIYFGLHYLEHKDSKPVDLIPVHKIETNFEPENGIYRCGKSGIYTFVFDNKYSWFNSKQIYYSIKIINPKEYIEV